MRPSTDEPIPDSFRRDYEAVVAARGLVLPAAEILWSDFVEWLWAEGKDYETRWGLKRRWRSWVLHERPVETAPVTSVPPPPSGTVRRARPTNELPAAPAPSVAATAAWQRAQAIEAEASRTMPIAAKLAMARGPLEALRAMGVAS